jgi:GTP pyrophosphokinase
LIEVSWGTRQQTVPTSIRILAYDRTGLLHEIAGIISAENINIDRSGVEPDHRKNTTTIYITVGISDITQLSRVLTKIEQLPNVIEARRYTG